MYKIIRAYWPEFALRAEAIGGLPDFIKIVHNTVQDPGAAAVVRGFNLHDKIRVDGQDRQQLEKLCRYIARPPMAQDRLHILEDGRVRYEMKRIFKDGTKAIVLSPLDFIARLCALVPPPYFHLSVISRSQRRREISVLRFLALFEMTSVHEIKRRA